MSQLVCPEMVMRMANIVVDVASRVCMCTSIKLDSNVCVNEISLV